eukprot:2358528-Amphidinium_carterae.1
MAPHAEALEFVFSHPTIIGCSESWRNPPPRSSGWHAASIEGRAPVDSDDVVVLLLGRSAVP